MHTIEELETERERILAGIREKCGLSEEKAEKYAISLRHRIHTYDKHNDFVKEETARGLKEDIEGIIERDKISELIDGSRDAFVDYIKTHGNENLFNFDIDVRKQEYLSKEVFRLKEAVLFFINLGRIVNLRKNTAYLETLISKDLDQLRIIEFNLHFYSLCSDRLNTKNLGKREYKIKATKLIDEYLRIGHKHYLAEDVSSTIIKDRLRKSSFTSFYRALMLYYDVCQELGEGAMVHKKDEIMRASGLYEGLSYTVEIDSTCRLPDKVTNFYGKPNQRVT